MSTDPVAGLVAYARSLGLTDEHLRLAALQLREGGLTLADALQRVEPSAIAAIETRYGRGMVRVLHGEGPTVAGFAAEPLYDFTAMAGRGRAQALLELIQGRMVARNRELGRVPAGGDRRLGRGAVEAYVRALRAIGAVLVEARLLAMNPMTAVALPGRAGPTRDRSLSLDELNDYLRIVLLRSREPLLDAVCWLILRLTAARLSELTGLRRPDLVINRPSLVLDGKGVRTREAPVHRPVARLISELDRGRPEGHTLLRTLRGGSLTRRHFDDWSEWVHEQYDWARGHQLRCHVLRHTTARAVERAVGADTIDAILFLGHSPTSRQGTTGVYTEPGLLEQWPRRLATSEAVFGPLDSWPELPENDVLATVPELKEWMRQ